MLIIIGIIIILIFSTLIYQSQKKTNVLNEVKVEFKGYDGNGILSYNSDDLKEEITNTCLKKAGFNSKEIDGIVTGDNVTLSNIGNDETKLKKLFSAQAMADSISYSFDKDSELQNGDKVTISIKSSSTETPIKNTSKSYTVKGLKKIQSISAKSVLTKHPIAFTGFNGFGQIEDTDYKKYYSTIENNNLLSNDDTISIQISDTYISQQLTQGKKITGDTETTIKVTGLKEINDISNLDEAIALIDNLVKNNYKDIVDGGVGPFTYEEKFTISKTSTFAKINGASENDFTIANIYKIDKNTTSTSQSNSSKTFYVIYGYEKVPYKNEQLVLSNLSKTNNYNSPINSYTTYTSADEAKAALISESSNYKEVN